jgi:hypothetical protein
MPVDSQSYSLKEYTHNKTNVSSRQYIEDHIDHQSCFDYDTQNSFALQGVTYINFRSL